jgi:chromosome segregation ATPase
VDINSLVETISTGILSGGASTLTALGATFRSIRSRLSKLESLVGNDDEPKTGLVGSVDALRSSVRYLRQEIEGWNDSAPEWATRAAQRASRSSFSTEALQESVDALARRVDATRKELNASDERTDNDLDRLRVEVAALSTWLRATLQELGMLDGKKISKPPPPLPRPPAPRPRRP